MKLIYQLIIIFLVPVSCLAQVTISGRVLSSAGKKPVANASVFLSNATVGGNTGKDGAFSLQAVHPGKYELIVSFVGFETYSQTLSVGNENIDLKDILISPKIIALKEVTIKVDHNREKYFNLFYNRFKAEFLGRSEFAQECRILNPELLDFDYDEATDTLTASSGDYLKIENDALGYKIDYLLTNFKQNNNEIHYQGPVLFTEMKGTPAQEIRWKENRKRAYEGSSMHFLRSLPNDNLEQVGFRVYQLQTYANPERPPDNVINAMLKKYNVSPGIARKLGFNPDSLPYWKSKAKLPKMFQKLFPFSLEKGDLVLLTNQPGIFALGCDEAPLLFDYDKNHRFTSPKQLEDLNHLDYLLTAKSNNRELSLLSFNKPYVLFDNNGRVIDPDSFSLNGAWARDRVGDLLPVNYAEGSELTYNYTDPLVNTIEAKASAFAANNPVEKVHLHFDRPWYGPGDTIWFKAYTVTGAKHQLSAVSNVLYTELVNKHDSVIKRLTLNIESGIAQGDFILPYDLKEPYHIRAYTNWMRNDSAYFYEPKMMVGGFPASNIVSSGASKLQAPNPNISRNVDVQFFPEGGYLVDGLRSKVAFKAINGSGLAEQISGTITDQDGNRVAAFNTQHAGMGEFMLSPMPGKRYQAKITAANGSNFTVDLPEAKNEGFTLAINNEADSIYIKVSANDLYYKNHRDSRFYLIALSGGKSYYSASDKLFNKVFTTALDRSHFPSGIVQFTLFSQAGEPLNERIIFVKNDDGLNLKLSTQNATPHPQEDVKITLEAMSPDDKPVLGTFSVSVTDETKVPTDEQKENTIFTDLLLTSALKGYVENPNYYFINNNEKPGSDLDLLMLTQGYRKFEWERILKDENPIARYKAETSLTLSGSVKTMSNQPVSHGKVQLTSVKDHFVADTVTDANGNFTFTNIDLPDTARVVINAQKAGGGNNVKITLNKPSYPVMDKTQAFRTLDTGMDGAVKLAMRQALTTGQQFALKHTIQLKEVKIKERKRNPVFEPVYSDNMKFSANLNGPGNANQVLLADKLLGCITLMDCLRGKLSGVTIDQNGLPMNIREMARSLTIKKPPQPMAVIVEGIQYGPTQLDNINVEDIYSIEVLTSVSYLAMYGSDAPHGALIITMKRGVQTPIASKIIDGLITYKFPGYHKARQFYSPKYEVKSPMATDDRKTIYWNPDIITDTNGKASFEYYNAVPGVYRVVVEGIDGYGNLGRQVYRYKVE